MPSYLRDIQHKIIIQNGKIGYIPETPAKVYGMNDLKVLSEVNENFAKGARSDKKMELLKELFIKARDNAQKLNITEDPDFPVKLDSKNVKEFGAETLERIETLVHNIDTFNSKVYDNKDCQWSKESKNVFNDLLRRAQSAVKERYYAVFSNKTVRSWKELFADPKHGLLFSIGTWLTKERSKFDDSSLNRLMDEKRLTATIEEILDDRHKCLQQYANSSEILINLIKYHNSIDISNAENKKQYHAFYGIPLSNKTDFDVKKVANHIKFELIPSDMNLSRDQKIDFYTKVKAQKSDQNLFDKGTLISPFRMFSVFYYNTAVLKPRGTHLQIEEFYKLVVHQDFDFKQETKENFKSQFTTFWTTKARSTQGHYNSPTDNSAERIKMEIRTDPTKEAFQENGKWYKIAQEHIGANHINKVMKLIVSKVYAEVAPTWKYSKLKNTESAKVINGGQQTFIKQDHVKEVLQAKA